MQKIIYCVSVAFSGAPIYSVEFDSRDKAEAAAERASRIGFNVTVATRAVSAQRAA